jgi:hypothetical protein
LRQSGRSAVREVSSRKDEDRKGRQGAGLEPTEKKDTMQIMKVDPRALKENPGRMR